MVYLVVDFTQGSEAWKEFRKGKITGTSAWKLLAGQSPEDIIKESLEEDSFAGNKYTQRGHVLEDEARKLYEEINHIKVNEVGAIINSKYSNAMVSPDGIIGEKSGIEIKSFLPEHMNDVWAHLDSHIIAQIQWALFISEREYWDLILFNPELPPEDAYKVKRFYPDEEIFQKFRDALNSKTDLSVIQETGLTLIKLEQELQSQEEALKVQLEIRDKLNSQISELKQRLKDITTGKVSKTLNLGGDELSLSIYDTVKVSPSNVSEIEDEYLLKEELPDAFIENGRVYQKVPNTKLVQNMLKVGKSLPQGFNKSTTRTIRLKLNGKSI